MSVILSITKGFHLLAARTPHFARAYDDLRNRQAQSCPISLVERYHFPLASKVLCAPRHAKESHMHMLKTRPDMVDVKPVDDYTSYHANHE